MKPSFEFNNELGRLCLYRKAYPNHEMVANETMFERLRDTLDWKRNSMHGNHDRMIWDGTKATCKYKQLMSEIGRNIERVLGVKDIGDNNFANYYKNEGNRTFWHRDHDINPDDLVTMVTFGSPRTLTFVDYMTDKVYEVELGDYDIVTFDFNWNMNTFHAVEKSRKEEGERISLQFFNIHSPQKWGRENLKKWKETEPIKEKAVSRRRSKINKKRKSC